MLDSQKVIFYKQKNKKQIVKLHKYNYAKNDGYKFKKNCEQFTY